MYIFLVSPGFPTCLMFFGSCSRFPNFPVSSSLYITSIMPKPSLPCYFYMNEHIIKVGFSLANTVESSVLFFYSFLPISPPFSIKALIFLPLPIQFIEISEFLILFFCNTFEYFGNTYIKRIINSLNITQGAYS